MRYRDPSLTSIVLVSALVLSVLPVASASYNEVQQCYLQFNFQASRGSLILEFERPVEGYIVLNTSVRRAFTFRGPVARRYVDVPVFFAFRVNGTRAVLPIPPGIDRISISGPFSASIPFVPFTTTVNDLGGSATLTLRWPAEVGCAVSLELLPLLEGGYPAILIEVPALAVLAGSGTPQLLDPNAQMIIGRSVPELFFLASRFVLPPLGEVEVRVEVRFNDKVRDFSFRLAADPGASVTFSEVAQHILRVNRESLDELRKGVKSTLEGLELSGFYLGNARTLFNIVEKIEPREERLEEAFEQRLAYSMLQNLRLYLQGLERGPGFVYALLLSVAEAILCVTAGWRLTDNWPLKVAYSLALFAGISLLTSLLMPHVRLEMVAPASLAAVLGVFSGLKAVLKLRPLQGASTASGATLEGLLSSTISFSISFLARRRLRAVLLLLTTVLVAFGATCLTAFTMHVALSHQSADRLPEGLDATYLVARGYGSASQIIPVDVAGFMFLSSRGEVANVAPSAIAIYPVNPYDTLNGLPISGIFGLTRDSPVAGILEEQLLQGSATGIRAGAIIVSDAVARSVRKGVGDVIEIGGNTYEIVGIFDSQRLNRLKDIDGNDLLPTVMVGMSSYRPPAESVVFMHYQDAVLAGAYTHRVYVKLTEGADSAVLARALSLLGGLCVYIASPGKPIEIFYPGYHFTLVGAELTVPSIIALLIVYASFVGFVYEVRKDVFTLSTLGATPDQVFLLFIVMACVVGFSGGVAGYLAGLLAFRAFGAMDLRIPVDVKLDTWSLLFSIFLPVALALLGSLSPASRAVIAAVPSLRRRWTPEAEEAGRDEAEREVTLVTPIPVVIRSKEKAREFSEFLERKLTEMSGHKQSVYHVSRWEEGGEERPIFAVYFEYLQVEGRAFKSYNTVRIQRRNGEYTVELESRIVTIYTMFVKECLRDVASLVRKLTLEWRAESL